MIKTTFQLSKPVVHGTRQIWLIEYVHRYTWDAPPDAIPVGCAGASKPDHQRYCSIVAGYGSMKKMVKQMVPFGKLT